MPRGAARDEDRLSRRERKRGRACPGGQRCGDRPQPDAAAVAGSRPRASRRRGRPRQRSWAASSVASSRRSRSTTRVRTEVHSRASVLTSPATAPCPGKKPASAFAGAGEGAPHGRRGDQAGAAAAGGGLEVGSQRLRQQEQAADLGPIRSAQAGRFAARDRGPIGGARGGPGPRAALASRLAISSVRPRRARSSPAACPGPPIKASRPAAGSDHRGQPIRDPRPSSVTRTVPPGIRPGSPGPREGHPPSPGAAGAVPW